MWLLIHFWVVAIVFQLVARVLFCGYKVILGVFLMLSHSCMSTWC